MLESPWTAAFLHVGALTLMENSQCVKNTHVLREFSCTYTRWHGRAFENDLTLKHSLYIKERPLYLGTTALATDTLVFEIQMQRANESMKNWPRGLYCAAWLLLFAIRGDASYSSFIINTSFKHLYICTCFRPKSYMLLIDTSYGLLIRLVWKNRNIFPGIFNKSMPFSKGFPIDFA